MNKYWKLLAIIKIFKKLIDKCANLRYDKIQHRKHINGKRQRNMRIRCRFPMP